MQLHPLRWVVERKRGMDHGMSPINQRLRATTRNLGDVDLPRHDPTNGQAIGIKSDSLQLFKHPLTHDQAHAVGVAHRYPRREKGTWESR